MDEKTRTVAEIAILLRLGQRAAAFLLGVSARCLRDHTEIQRDPAGRYDGRSLVKWAERRAVERGPEVAAETREALDLQRLRKLQIANDKAEGKLVPADTTRETILWAASAIRGCGEKLRREHGEKALAILDEMLDELDAQCEREQAAQMGGTK